MTDEEIYNKSEYNALVNTAQANVNSAKDSVEKIITSLRESAEYVPVDSSGGRDALGSNTYEQINSMIQTLSIANRKVSTINRRLKAEGVAKALAEKVPPENTTTAPAKKYASTN